MHTHTQDRAHRIGQTRVVTVKYFLAENTVDDLLWPLVRVSCVCESEAACVLCPPCPARIT